MADPGRELDAAREFEAAAALPPAIGGTVAAGGLIRRLTGARLVYGKPVRAKKITVVPVASVRAVGGGGFGRQADTDAGGGGGGFLEAHPVGFVEIGPQGARFERIRPPMEERLANVVRAAAGVAQAFAAMSAITRSRQGPRGSTRRRLFR